MDLVTPLLDTAVLDSRQLYINRSAHGDRPDAWRDLDFAFYAESQQQAETVASFITDNRYGAPSVQCVKLDGGKITWRILLVIRAPATDEIVHTLSGFMVCLAAVFGLEYDGWACMVQGPATPPPLPPW